MKIMKQLIAIFIFGIVLFIIPWQLNIFDTELETRNEWNNPFHHQTSELKSIPEIASSLGLADVEYYPELVNHPLKAQTYTGKRKIAANIGVYLTDLMYAKNAGGQNEAYKNYAALMELAGNSGLNNELTEIIYERFENDNISAEELQNMIKEALTNSALELSENQQKKLYAYLVMGNYIEKLYLSSDIIMRPKQTKLPAEAEALLKRSLMKQVSDLSGKMQEITDLMHSFDGDANDNRVRKEIEELNKRSLALEERKPEFVNLSYNELLDVKEVYYFITQIERIRANVVA